MLKWQNHITQFFYKNTLIFTEFFFFFSNLNFDIFLKHSYLASLEIPLQDGPSIFRANNWWAHRDYKWLREKQKYEVENLFNYKKKGNIMFTLSCKLHQLFRLKVLLQTCQCHQQLLLNKMFNVTKNWAWAIFLTYSYILVKFEPSYFRKLYYYKKKSVHLHNFGNYMQLHSNVEIRWYMFQVHECDRFTRY